MRHPITIHKAEWNDNLLLIWYEMYLEGKTEFPAGMSLMEFTSFWIEELKECSSTYVGFQDDNLIAIGFLYYKEHILEPHIVMYKKQSTRTCLELYATFFQYALLNSDIHGCLLRCTIKNRKIFERLGSKGILKFYRYVDTAIRGREYWYIFTGNYYKGIS